MFVQTRVSVLGGLKKNKTSFTVFKIKSDKILLLAVVFMQFKRIGLLSKPILLNQFLVTPLKGVPSFFTSIN